MNVAIVGAGPAGLYLAILLKRDDPSHQVTVYERNRVEDTFGFGVVFSDETLENVGEADPETNQAMAAAAAHWEDIEIHYRGTVMRSTGHRFSGLERKTLLELLARRAQSLGVEVHWQREIRDLSDCGLPAADLIVAADGAASLIRDRLSDQFQPQLDWRRNRFVWLGSTRPFPAFTFYFKPSPVGLWRTHAYQYAPGRSTFIVEAREETWKASGLDENDEQATVAYLEQLFQEELQGHRLLANRSIWRRFPTVRNARWHSGNVVLLGDAAHTAHFSVGSGTKLAMEDAIALAAALKTEASIPAALASYEAGRRPQVESLQRAAQASLEWFESAERYHDTEPLQFAFNLLTRSLRITHENLKLRDPALVAQVDRWFAEQAGRQSGRPVTLDPCPPPLFTPYRLRELVLPNRIVVSSMCQYRADDGLPNDWHLVHLGSRAIGGAGLVMTEMTDVSREAPDLTRLLRDVSPGPRRRVAADRGVRAPGERGQDRHPARARGQERLDPGALGRRGRAAGRRELAADRAVSHPLPVPQPDAAGDDPGRHGRGGAPTSSAPPRWPTPPGSTCWSCTWRTAICWPRSSRRSPTGEPTSTVDRSPTGCATRWRS